MNGALIVDKPAGPTSHDVVSRARRALGTRRIGHTGTLDPTATGVLVLLIGQATRLARFLSRDAKEYIADVRFGIATATYDAAGDAVGSGIAEDGSTGNPVDLLNLELVLSEFRGTYSQVPPAFSAKKIAGARAYALARAGQAPELAPVQVTVSALEVLARDVDMVRLRVACSSGFYVRSLAHDLGQRLGCGAHLEALRRTRAGSFSLENAVPLGDIEAAGVAASRWLLPLHAMLPDLPVAVLNDDGSRRARHGSLLSPADLAEGRVPPAGERTAAGRVALTDRQGALVAVAEWVPGGALHPVVVLV